MTNYPLFDTPRISSEFREYLQRRKPSLSPELRKLIDDAIAAGMVKVIPVGVSGADAYVWDSEENKLVSTAPKSLHERKSEAFLQANKNNAAREKAKADVTREKIRELFNLGFTTTEISARINLSTVNVRKHIRTMKLR